MAKLKDILTNDPGRMIRITGSTTAESPFIMMLMEDLSPVTLNNIKFTPVLITNTGRVVGKRSYIRVRPTIGPGLQRSVDSGLSGLSADQLEGLRFRVDSVEIVE